MKKTQPGATRERFRDGIGGMLAITNTGHLSDHTQRLSHHKHAPKSSQTQRLGDLYEAITVEMSGASTRFIPTT